jgi:PII-like signaling protein
MNTGTMKTIEVTHVEVTMVRVYLTEAETHLSSLLKHLNDEHKVRGVTVFRGIAGFGQSGKLHSSSLLDMSLDLPVVIEFFDEPAKAASMIESLYSVVGAGHIVSWPVQLTVDKAAN